MNVLKLLTFIAKILGERVLDILLLYEVQDVTK